MACIPVLPLMPDLLPGQLSDSNARFIPANTRAYATPLDRSVEATRQRTDLWLVVGQVATERSISNFPENPVVTATVGQWHNRQGQLYSHADIIYNVVRRMASTKKEIFQNSRTIVQGIVNRTHGADMWRGYTPTHRINIFRRLYQKDPYSVASAMLAGAAARAINLDAVFDGQNTFYIGQGATAFDQVTVLQQWFQCFFEETCEIIGRGEIYYPHDDVPSSREMSNSFYGLRGRFLHTFHNPDVNRLDPRNMPVR